MTLHRSRARRRMRRLGVLAAVSAVLLVAGAVAGRPALAVIDGAARPGPGSAQAAPQAPPAHPGGAGPGTAQPTASPAAFQHAGEDQPGDARIAIVGCHRGQVGQRYGRWKVSANTTKVDGIADTQPNEQGAQLNDITRKLAAWAAIIAVPTAVAGFSGQTGERPRVGQDPALPDVRPAKRARWKSDLLPLIAA